MHICAADCKGLDMSVAQFRAFKVANVTESQFFTSTNKNNESFAEDDLSRSGLTLDDIQAFTHPMLRLPEKALAGYVIPYFGLDGRPLVDREGNLIMSRTRLKYPDFSKEQRYTQPSGDQLGKYGLPPFLPYLHPRSFALDGDTVICCEGEKKTAAVVKYLELPAFGIGGCQLWRNPDGSGTLHPWIRDFLLGKGASTLTIIPDGDVFRYDICNAYGTFARAAESEGFKVVILNPRDKIDDLLVRVGREGAVPCYDGLDRININDLVQSPNSLIKKYGLAFRSDSKDRPVVHQHTANVMRLMDEHPAFPKVWKNLDNNRVMIGDTAAQPDLSEMDIANYFQYNLGFDKIGHKTIYACIQAMSKRNARSPMLDHIQSLEWDGEARLDTWLCRLWGVTDSPYTRSVGSKWLISACARMAQPGCKIDWMMIVVGPQATGKTSMPGIMFNGNNMTLYGDHNDKDLHMLLHSSLCVGFDELDSFGKRESSNLKAMVTRQEDAFRPPYGASVEVFPRRFTLYGCGNRYEFLQNDPSGYRRYAIVKVDRLLDFALLEAERDQLWAEAYSRYANGEPYWEVVGAGEEATKYAIANPLEDRLITWFGLKGNQPDSIHDGVVWFKLTEVLDYLGVDSKNPYQIREVGNLLLSMQVQKPEKTERHPTTKVVGRWYKVALTG